MGYIHVGRAPAVEREEDPLIKKGRASLPLGLANG